MRSTTISRPRLSHPCNIRIGQTEWDCSGADGESEAAGHESCFSSLAQRMHPTRRASGCSYRSRLILTFSSRRLPVCWPRETDLPACCLGESAMKREPLTHERARRTTRLMALLRITACEAANRKTRSAAAIGTQHPWRVPVGPAALPCNITQIGSSNRNRTVMLDCGHHPI